MRQVSLFLMRQALYKHLSGINCRGVTMNVLEIQLQRFITSGLFGEILRAYNDRLNVKGKMNVLNLAGFVSITS